MDKLKQVQKYQFWILLGVALILPLVGWSMARSGFVTEVEARTKSLKELHGQLNQSAGDPNQEWKKGIEAINVDQGQQKSVAWRYLWERQAPLMTWPAKMPSDPEKIEPRHQEYWRTAYEKLVADVRLKVNPIDDENPGGLIEYPAELLPMPEWVGGGRAPSVAQIVASQEDLWLLESLLAAIASVNTGADSVFNANIREIVELYLRGGSTKGSGGGAAKPAGGTPTGGGNMPGGGQMMMEMMERSKSIADSRRDAGGFGGMGAGMGGSGGGVAITPAKINPDDDLGPEKAAQVPKAAGGDKSSGGTKMSTTMMMPSMPAGDMMGGGLNSRKGAWSGSDKDRYRDNKDEWKTRGFHLEVIMDQHSVPELLTALSNASWPVNVLRIQMSDYRDEDLADVGSGMPGGGGRTPMMGPGRGGASSMQSMRMSMPPAGSSAGMGGKLSASKRSSAAARGDDEMGESIATSDRSTLDDPNLVHVAIVGLIYVVKKPPEDKTPAATPKPGAVPAASGGSTSPAVAGPAGAAGTETDAAANAAETADAAAEEEKPVDEPTGDENEKPADDTKPAEGANSDPAGDAARPDVDQPDAAPTSPGKT
jgi:hypothetical protein